jgi:hypothetical protein
VAVVIEGEPESFYQGPTGELQCAGAGKLEKGQDW